MSTTPNLGLALPASGTANWDRAVNGNFSIIDGAVGSNTSAFSDAEIPSPSGDGVTFTLANAPNPTASLLAFYNGLLQVQGSDYTLTANVMVFATDLGPRPNLIVWYRYS
jgi:hypothetical protein